MIGVVRVKFPNGLTDKEIDTDGILPSSLTGRQAMDHIEGKTIKGIVSTQAYCNILTRMMTRKYVPNGNGVVQYLSQKSNTVKSVLIYHSRANM